MKEGLNFVYDGIRSSEMGLMNVTVGGGFLEEPFLAERSIDEVQIKGRDKAYFRGISYSPLSFRLQFAFKDRYDENSIRRVARWLNQTTYKEFYTEDNPNRIFMCMMNSSSSLMHNGLKQGYLEIEMRCDSPYSYSPIYKTNERQPLDFSANTEAGAAYVFDNIGDVDCQPEMWLEKVGAGDVRIVNLSDGAKEFKLTGLADKEVVYIDNENRHLESSLRDNPYDLFNRGYLSLPWGANNLRIYGNVKISFRYRFRTLQG